MLAGGDAVTAPQRIGSYTIERLLGVGSFATVWLGYDPALDTRVAIKVLAENWSHDLRVRERFLDEARLLRRLEHERLIRVHAVGELPDGRPYAVLAWADGGSLRDRLAAGDHFRADRRPAAAGRGRAPGSPCCTGTASCTVTSPRATSCSAPPARTTPTSNRC